MITGRWSDEEVKVLTDNLDVITIHEIAEKLNRTYKSTYAKAYKLGYKVNNKHWTRKDLNYLLETWGSTSIVTIAKNLGRSETAVMQKAIKEGLGAFLDNGDYITLNQLMVEMRIKNKSSRQGGTYTLNQWIDKGLPVKTKRVRNSSFKIVYLDDFWNWAEMHSTLLNFSHLEEFALGPEPKWLKEQRQADIEYSYFKRSPWTDEEDKRLEDLVNSFEYGYKDISKRLMRTEGAVKRRLCDLDIQARPIRKPNHSPWQTDQVDILTDMYLGGYSPDVISHYIEGKSAQACRGKIERMIIDGDLFPRSEFRKSC